AASCTTTTPISSRSLYGCMNTNSRRQTWNAAPILARSPFRGSVTAALRDLVREVRQDLARLRRPVERAHERLVRERAARIGEHAFGGGDEARDVVGLEQAGQVPALQLAEHARHPAREQRPPRGEAFDDLERREVGGGRARVRR